jgi:putative sugar O-methyltransferase
MNEEIRRLSSRPSLRRLKVAYDGAVAYVDYVEQTGRLDTRDDLSKFWKDVLGERHNYPSFNEMLLMRRGFTYPMADRRDVADTESERAYADAAWHVVSRSMPVEALRSVEESPFGAPTTFDFDGTVLSAGGIVNSLTAHRVLELCRANGLTNRPVRILEIGPGYGHVANTLLDELDVELYAICDLPENLVLSSFYLQGNHPKLAVSYARDDGGTHEQGLSFAVPQLLNALPGRFDFVMNSYSFQEMTRESVEAYFAFAHERLTDDGLFYSFNSHGKSGILRASDYPLERFRLDGLTPARRFPFQLFGSIPYEAVMSRRGSVPPDPDLAHQVDAITDLFQFGLFDELDDLVVSFLTGHLTPPERSWLTAVGKLFDAPDLAAKEQLAARLEGLPHVSGFLHGAIAFARRRDEEATQLLERVELGETQARVCAAVMLACLGHARGDVRETASRTAEALALAPHLEGEISTYAKNPSGYANYVAYRLRAESESGPSRRRLLGTLKARKAPLKRGG